MALKVLMLGGRRCGKTSALASMFDQMINGPIKKVFTISNSTDYKTKTNLDGNEEKQDTLEAKTIELQNYLENPSTGVFMVDSNPTRCVWQYSLRLQIRGTKRDMEMQFLDCPGEFFQAGNHDADTTRFVEDSDVYIIMVDTPYLMECQDSIAKGVNCITDIHNFLTHIKCTDEKSAKMVVIVPIKCEKWLKEERIGEVVEKVKSSYSTLLTALDAYTFVNVAIIPIQTAGNIEFMEMSEAYTLSSANNPNNKIKCAKLSDKRLRLYNGKYHNIKQSDIINTDIDAIVCGNVHKPHAWFAVSENPELVNNSLYAPHNCEQLPLHILKFWFAKTESSAWGPLLGWIMSKIFGSITKKDMRNCLADLHKMNSIKKDVDGITYIKQVVFK